MTDYILFPLREEINTLLVQTSYLSPGESTPLIITPAVEGLRLADWVASNREFLAERLARHGGILFRRFDLRTQDDFQEVLAVTGVQMMSYNERSTPRKQLGDNVFTSTEFPAEETIALHNESSTSATYPMKIWFFALQPAQRGGETPIADVRDVYKQLSETVRKEFLEKGWLLIRNYNDGFGISWEEAFHTTDKKAVEEYCRQSAISFEWKSNNRLRTRQIRPAITGHPQTGEMVWFNHIAFWHPSSLERSVRETLLDVFEKEDLPYYTCYGDGSEIKDEVVEEIRAAYRDSTVTFPWETGDLLMLDNMLVAHGRSPYQGSRRILVAMGEPYIRPDL